MSRRIYVAGASAELYRAVAFIRAARNLGYEITEDWPQVILDIGKANVGLTPEQRLAAADADLKGVLRAHLVVLLVPAHPSVTQGAWWEGGVAQAVGIPILAVGAAHDRERNIFLAKTCEIDTDDEALDLLKHLATLPEGDWLRPLVAPRT